MRLLRFRVNRVQSTSDVFVVVACVLLLWAARGCSSQSDSQCLLTFKASLHNGTSSATLLPSWNASTAPCAGRRANWEGILCNREGQVSGVRLENMSLSGTVDTLALANLTRLRSLSLMYNEFQGPLPDVALLSSLKAAYFTANNFSGALESAAFVGMRSLKKLHLARNQLGGHIPISLALLPRLVDLRLEENVFQGVIPNFQLRVWLSFNVSYNALVGSIPLTLKAINATSFEGNKGLCGAPLPRCAAAVPGESSTLSLVVMGVVVAMAVSALIAVVIILLRCRWRGECWWCGKGMGRKRTLSSTSMGRLSFVRQDVGRFEIQELLNAPAEMLGSGSLGSSYKAELGDGGPVVVVKRCKQMNNVGVESEELNDHMRRLGGLSHPNVVPLLAFYFKRDEKLFISDYAPTTLATLLQQRSGTDIEYGGGALGIECMVKIAVGVARGLRYLHDELPELMAAHGNLKASNVMVKDEFSMEVMLSDYGLIPLVNQEHAQQHMAVYKSPEYVNQGRITKKTDVWCLGMVILHMLTGNERPLLPECEEDEQAFLGKSSNVIAKKLFKIAVACCHSDFDRRPHIRHALFNLESIFSNSFTSG